MFFYTFVLLWYQNNEEISFFLLLQYSIEISLDIDASVNSFANVISYSRLSKLFVALSRIFPKIYGDIN